MCQRHCNVTASSYSFIQNLLSSKMNKGNENTDHICIITLIKIINNIAVNIRPQISLCISLSLAFNLWHLTLLIQSILLILDNIPEKTGPHNRMFHKADGYATHNHQPDESKIYTRHYGEHHQANTSERYQQYHAIGGVVQKQGASP